jgi:Bacterial regulatory helix-turn-helix protein, lysR family
LLLGALALTGWRPDRSITLLGISVLLSAVADMSYLDAVAHGHYDAPAWAASLWPASALVTAMAAWQPVVTVRPMHLEGRRLLVLPLVARIAAVVLLFVDHFDRVSHLGASLAFATLIVAGVRLWLTLGEHMTLLGTSRGEATTDPLRTVRAAGMAEVARVSAARSGGPVSCSVSPRRRRDGRGRRRGSARARSGIRAIDPRRVLTFRAVAHQRSFSRAARELALSQPSVSKHRAPGTLTSR